MFPGDSGRRVRLPATVSGKPGAIHPLETGGTYRHLVSARYRVPLAPKSKFPDSSKKM